MILGFGDLGFSVLWFQGVGFWCFGFRFSVGSLEAEEFLKP